MATTITVAMPMVVRNGAPAADTTVVTPEPEDTLATAAVMAVYSPAVDMPQQHILAADMPQQHMAAADMPRQRMAAADMPQRDMAVAADMNIANR